MAFVSTFDRGDLSTSEEGLQSMNSLNHHYYQSFFVHLHQGQRNTIMEKNEETELFEALRQHTMQGIFTNPVYAGNNHQAGWKLIGFPSTLAFTRLHI
ncbi:gluconate 2-dehydrogenase subunit 3 family protein [Salicibibacter kimchii]|nr:gluconate 2-dehydrogenase subunit 3 family protein [Salicibibacter kimchii]